MAPLATPRLPPGVAYLVLGVFAGALLLTALNQEGVFKRGALATIALTVGAFIFLLNSSANAVQPRQVRINSTGPLHFAPRRRLATSYFVVAILGAIPGPLAIIGTSSSGEDFGRTVLRSAGWLAVVSVVSLAWLVRQLWGLRNPAGLNVSPDGLSGVRNSASLLVSWAEVKEASSGPGYGGPLLNVSLTDGSIVAVHGMHIGSDPNLVAAIIEHFLSHPEDRPLLADAAMGIRAVENAPTLDDE